MPEGKLTAAQREMLKRMATGEEVWTVTAGRNPSVFWKNAIMARSPHRASVRALARAGLVADYVEPNLRWRGEKFRITEAGRAALALTEQKP